MTRKKVVLRFLISLCFLSLGLLAPSFASGASHKPTPSTSSEKPKKEEPANTTPTEIKPSPASKPVESKSAEVKPSNEAKPTEEAKPSKEAKPTEEAKPSKEAKADSQVKKPEKTATEKQNVKSDVKVNGKTDSKSDSKSKNSNSNKNESTKGDKGLGEEKKAEKVDSSSPVPSPQASKSSTPAITSDAPTQSNSAEVLPESFVRIEKSNGNKATLIVSRQKIGSVIKITITSKGPSK